jgi:hypothetical protein
LVQSLRTNKISIESINKYWIRLKRKIESEIFFDSHKCQWKLGISHEGVFPGMKRVVLRPRFDEISNDNQINLSKLKQNERRLNQNGDEQIEKIELVRKYIYLSIYLSIYL